MNEQIGIEYRTMSRRYPAMDEVEVWSFLSSEKRVVRVASVDADGYPHVLPVWFAVVDRALGIRSAADARAKIMNLLNTGKFGAVVDEGEGRPYSEQRGVLIRGLVQEATPAFASATAE